MYRYDYKFPENLKSTCNIWILHFRKIKYIGFEDINIGSSVTNSTEFLATDIIAINGWDPDDCLFFEWYLNHEESTVDEIIYTWNGNEAANPVWKMFCTQKDNPFKI